MPDLLLELFSEEIPARMQRRGAEDLKRLITDALVEAGLTYEGARAYATPRRLALHVVGVPLSAPDRTEERRGPRVGAPQQAIDGFVKAAGLASIEEAEVVSDPKKGDFYVARRTVPGRPAVEVLAEAIPEAVRRFPWPKSMRWGAASAGNGALSWVRPLHSIVATFGPETGPTEVIAFDLPGVAVGQTTRGHRFMAPRPIRVKRFDDYATALEKAKVVLDADRRKDIILADARDRALALGLELVEDEALLEEVAGLVEWPVVLLGTFDVDFLDLPDAVIRSTIRTNQKCFVLTDPKAGRLANRFVLVANIEADDGGSAIVAGNERVVRARLSDARFFFQTDLAEPLPNRIPKLGGIVYHEKLGSQGERVQRIARLAEEIAAGVGAEPRLAKLAAGLAKADLVTEMVGEFPELQGHMGRIYAERQGIDPAVAAAIEDHYRPLGPSDRVPSEPTAIAVALADKLDHLAAFWAIGEKPTGSKDPFALRRAALGVIRIVLENAVRLRLSELSRSALVPVLERIGRAGGTAAPEALVADLVAFFHDRLKVQLREQGARHDLVDAVLAAGVGDEEGAHRSLAVHEDDLLMIVRRVEALGAFLSSEDGANLLTGHRRAANILKAEEKKDGRTYHGRPRPELFRDQEEIALAAAIDTARDEAEVAIVREDFATAMAALARLRAPVDAFFDKVLVNAEEPAVRENRLKLLNEIRSTTLAVADFSKIQ